MRLFEITETRSPIIVVTKRFKKNYEHYARGYPGLGDKTEKFLAAKQANPSGSLGVNDKPFTGGPLTGIMHVHLVHGKVMLIYAVRNDQIRLYDIGEHNDFEGKKVNHLADYIKSLGDDSFVPDFEHVVEELTTEQKKTIIHLIYEMATNAEDLKILQAAAKTKNYQELMGYFEMVVVDQSPDVIIHSFGGADGLSRAIKAVMAQLGV